MAVPYKDVTYKTYCVYINTTLQAPAPGPAEKVAGTLTVNFAKPR